MNYNFDEIIDRTGTNSLKLEAGEKINPYLPKVYIPLWVADMDFACAPQILAAMHARLDRRILGYTNLGEDCKNSVVRWMQRRFDWNIDAREIVFSAGVVSAIFTAVELLSQPGDGVCFLTPAYHPFEDAVRRQNRNPLYVRLVETNGSWTIDFNALERTLAREDCKVFIHCDPHNPTGRVFTEAELKRIAALCFANNVFIVSDEIHADLTRAGVAHTPLAKLFPAEKRILTCTSPSKSFNMAGNNHAHIIIPDSSLRSAWTKNRFNSHPTALSNEAVIAAYDESEDWLEALLSYLDDNFAMMQALLSEKLPQATFSIPEGTYLGFVDLSAFGLDERQLKERISRAGVFVQFGEDFVENGTCHMRINVACPRSVLKEGLERICGALQQI